MLVYQIEITVLYLNTTGSDVEIMFKWLKSDPTQKMQKDYEALLSKAMNAQRNGDIRTYSMLTEQANELYQKIEATKGKE